MHIHYAQDQMGTPQVVKKVGLNITNNRSNTIYNPTPVHPKVNQILSFPLHWPQLSFTFQLMGRSLTISIISKGLTAMKLIRIIIHSYAWYKRKFIMQSIVNISMPIAKKNYLNLIG